MEKGLSLKSCSRCVYVWHWDLRGLRLSLLGTSKFSVSAAGKRALKGLEFSLLILHDQAVSSSHGSHGKKWEQWF